MKNICSELTLHTAFDVIKVRFLFQYVFGDVDEYGDYDDLDLQL